MTPSRSSARSARCGSPSKPSSPYGLSSRISRSAFWQISSTLRAPLGRQRDPGRVVEVRDRVEELDLLAGRPDRGDRLLQRLRLDAVVVHRDVNDLALVRAENAQRTDVRRRLADHHVARIAEHPGDQVDRLLAADRDDDVVRMGVDALEPHHVADLVAQRRIALTGAVLHRGGAVVDHQVADRAADHVERQTADVRHPARERDHLRPAGDREQGPDLRCGHALGPCCVPVDVVVETGLPDVGQVSTHGATPRRTRGERSSGYAEVAERVRVPGLPIGATSHYHAL